jgi:predicted DNA-binding transcriptional regulator YafY
MHLFDSDGERLVLGEPEAGAHPTHGSLSDGTDRHVLDQLAVSLAGRRRTQLLKQLRLDLDAGRRSIAHTRKSVAAGAARNHRTARADDHTNRDTTKRFSGKVSTMQPFDVIIQEARAHRTVEIEAREKDGSCETREVEPYSVRHGREQELLYFHCLERDATRCVLVGNILAARPTGRSFTPRYEVEL